MLLTIGMIVKNEEKYLRSCLEAIAPILHQVDSELVIADTGSTDSTVEIARAFTDKVFPFAWCDDFSAARNSTLEKAQGEWYMTLDADEIFEDVTAIIDFFNTGEYKKYNSATYKIRSYNDEQRTVFSDYDGIRLLKIGKDTRYVNRIHERVPYYTPTKKLTSQADHFGYLSENNQEFIEKKSKRNRDLLFMELHDDPQNCKYYLEIGQNYDMAKDYETALEYFYKGLECAKEQKDPLTGSFYADIALIRYHQKQYFDILDITKEYFSIERSYQEIDLQMYFLEGLSLYELKKNKEAVRSYKKYVECYRAHHSRDRSNGALQYVVRFTDALSFRLACLNLVHSCMEERDYTSGQEYIKYIPISDWTVDDRGIQKRLALEMNLMAAIENYDQLPVLFRTLSGKSLFMLQSMVEQIVNERKRNLILTEVVKSDLPETDYIKLLRLRYQYDSRSITKDSVEEFITGIKEWNPLYADVIYFALYCRIDFSMLTSKINAYDLNRLLFSSKFLHFRDLPKLIFTSVESLKEYSGMHKRLWLMLLSSWALRSGQLEKEEMLRLFRFYAEISGVFLTEVYKEEVLKEDNIVLLPKDFQIAFYCNLAATCEDKGENSRYVNCLKSVIRFAPEFKTVVKMLLEDFQEKLNRSNVKVKLSQFETYATAVKENIRRLIDEGNLRKAYGLLGEYEQLCPNDTELPALKNRIESSKDWN